MASHRLRASTVFASVLAAATCTQAGHRKQAAVANDSFRDENVGKFVGRHVQDLMTAFPVPYREAYPIDEPPCKLVGFAFAFPDGTVVDVYCQDLQHLPRFR